MLSLDDYVAAATEAFPNLTEDDVRQTGGFGLIGRQYTLMEGLAALDEAQRAEVIGCIRNMAVEESEFDPLILENVAKQALADISDSPSNAISGIRVLSELAYRRLGPELASAR